MSSWEVMLELNAEEKKQNINSKTKKGLKQCDITKHGPVCMSVEGVSEQLELASVQIICVVHR